MTPTVPDDYAAGGPPPLPPEFLQLMQQFPGSGLQHLKDGGPPFLGPLSQLPTNRELDRFTEVKHSLEVRLLNAMEPSDLEELRRILRQCAEGLSQITWSAHRWDDGGLRFFLIYDTPTRMLKTSAQATLPVSPR